MMKKVLPVAVAALVLSVGGAFAEAPNSDTPGDTSSVDYDQLERVADSEMATLAGGAWWSGACTGAIHAAGVSLVVSGYLNRNTIMETVGLFTLRLECV